MKLNRFSIACFCLLLYGVTSLVNANAQQKKGTQPKSDAESKETSGFTEDDHLALADYFLERRTAIDDNVLARSIRERYDRIRIYRSSKEGAVSETTTRESADDSGKGKGGKDKGGKGKGEKGKGAKGGGEDSVKSGKGEGGKGKGEKQGGEKGKGAGKNGKNKEAGKKGGKGESVGGGGSEDADRARATGLTRQDRAILGAFITQKIRRGLDGSDLAAAVRAEARRLRR